MLVHRPLVTTIATLVCAVSLQAQGDLRWQGNEYPFDAITEDLPTGALDAVRLWEPWTVEHEYRMDLSQDGRALLLTLNDSRGRKRARQNLALVEDVLERIDAVFARPESPRVEAMVAGERDGFAQSGDIPFETATAVLAEMDEVEHHAAAVDFILEDAEYLRGWGPAAKNMTGFVLEQPLVAAWQPKAGIKEDWEGESTNEMVNRLTQLMTLRRFGRLPYWIGMGVAWNVEMEAQGGVYCFPYHNGFVSAADHGQWDKALRNRFKRRKEPIEMSELTGLKRGSFDLEAAQLAWGTVEFLNRHHPGALAEIGGELHRIWDEQARITNADGSWTRMVDFEPSDQDQLAVFEDHVPGFLIELQSFFVKGKSYRSP